MDSRIPLPNSLRCPALALFRKYNYPDKALVEAFKDETTKEYLEKISNVAVELKDDGTIKEYGRSIEPEHITRRVGHSNGSSQSCISGGDGGGEGNKENLIIHSGQGHEHSEDSSSSGRISESTE